MSIIVPAGKKNVEWSPKDETVVKTASTGSKTQEQIDPLYKAAKDYADSLNEETKESPVIEIQTQEGEKTEECATEKIQDATEKIDEAVSGLKDAVEDLVVSEEAEIEIEVEDEKEEKPEDKKEEKSEDEKEEVEIPGEEVSQGEIIVTSEPDEKVSCAKEKKEVAMDKSAEVAEEFCKYAKISPSNRKKLMDYWSNMLGYPKDFVSLLVKDYEK